MLPPTGSKQLSRSRENISASGWSIGDETARTLAGQWNTYAGPSPRLGWDTATRGRLNQTCPKPSGLPRTIISTGSSKSRGSTGVSSVQAAIHSPSGQISSARGICVEPKEKKPSPSSGKVSADQPLQHMSFPKLSDVGSDREADSSLDFSRLFNALDRCQVSTPRKVGTLPFVPRLDKPDQAVPTEEDSVTAEAVSYTHLTLPTICSV